MVYNLENNRGGKYYSELIRINLSFEKGSRVVVITDTPEKVKNDFKYMTSLNICLEPVINSIRFFHASLLTPEGIVKHKIK